MRKTFNSSLAAVWFLLLFAPLNFAWGDSGLTETLKLNNADDVAAATRLSESLSAYSKLVTTCVGSKQGDGPTCQCIHKTELEDLKSSLAQTLKTHPEWADRLLEFNGPPGSAQLNLGTVKKSVETVHCK